MHDLNGVYIVILNWNGWRDTIACVQTLLPDVQRGARVLICDNASTDDSVAQIERWSRHALQPRREDTQRLNRLLDNGCSRPELQILSREQIEDGQAMIESPLVLVRNGSNLGFAAGNNIGLRFALAQPDMSHAWLLNNDTLVEPACLQAMLGSLCDSSTRAACGSVIHFVDQPERIQCLGGNRFDRRSGRALTSAGRGLAEDSLPGLADVAKDIDYLSGCSMLLPRAFLEEVGLMCEDYFLYYEEIDWFTRNAGRFDMCIATDAHLYHREGSSIGSRTRNRGPSLTADVHMFRSRLRFMRRFYPQHLWYCNLHNWLDALKRLLRGQARNARVIAGEIMA